MKDIIVNKELLDLSPEQIITEISRFSSQKDEQCIKFLVSSLKSNEFHSPTANLANFGPKIPFDEIFSLLKDTYQGKVNDYLQEILKSAEIELLVDKTQPNNPQSKRQLEIKIKLAAAVIDKYADLITLVIGEKTNKTQGDIIEKAKKSLKKLNDQLNGINLLFLVSTVKTECMQYMEQYEPSCLMSFFCTDKTIKKIGVMELVLSDLMRQGFSTAEMMGGILLLHPQISKVFNGQTKIVITSAFNRLFEQSQFNMNDSQNTEQMIQAYINRAKQLEVEWPLPFVMEKKVFNPEEYPKWSPGLEAS